MSLFDYQQSQEIDSYQYSFYALIMAAMRQADDKNLFKLKTAFPDEYKELKARYHSPGGVLDND